jgi:hypothetical protein
MYSIDFLRFHHTLFRFQTIHLIYYFNDDFSLDQYTGDKITYQIFNRDKLINNIDKNLIINIKDIETPISIPIY